MAAENSNKVLLLLLQSLQKVCKKFRSFKKQILMPKDEHELEAKRFVNLMYFSFFLIFKDINIYCVKQFLLVQ